MIMSRDGFTPLEVLSYVCSQLVMEEGKRRWGELGLLVNIRQDTVQLPTATSYPVLNVSSADIENASVM